MANFYVGTYTEGRSEKECGIHHYDFDVTTGVVTFRSVEESGPNPSFLTLNSDRSKVYAVNELDDGVVSSMDRDLKTGGLTHLGAQASHGGAPCFISLHPAEKLALVANYSGGTFAAFPIDADGRLESASDVVDDANGPVKPRRDTPPHPHMIAATPDGAFVMVTDLGLDATLVCRIENGTFSLVEEATALAKGGAGPRHFAFSPDGKIVYIINELDSTLDRFAYSNGRLTWKQSVSTLPDDFSGENSCAHVVVSSDGRFVYGSNRGHDSIAIFPVEGAAGELGPASFVASGGRTPRGFAIDPSGRWLLAANQSSNNMFVFARDHESGGLTPTGQEIELPAPVCIVFV